MKTNIAMSIQGFLFVTLFSVFVFTGYGDDDVYCSYSEIIDRSTFPPGFVFGAARTAYQVHVNGSDTAPVYKFLKASQSGFLGSTSIKWNFTKFLVNKEGQVISRYGTTTSPFSIEFVMQGNIKKALGL